MTDPRTVALVLASVRCNQPDRVDEWARWYDDEHLPALLSDGDTAIWATRHQLCSQPVPGQPSLGWSHLTIYGFGPDEPHARIERLFAKDVELASGGARHPNHAVIAVDTVEAHGAWTDKPAPTDALTGHILAWVLPADPDLLAEWDAWYDSTHAPDMLATGAFAAVTRWRRIEPTRFGSQDLTLYDVHLDPVTEAVDRSAAALPALIAAGRKHRSHTGGLAVPVEVSGVHGGRGVRPPKTVDGR